MTRKKLSKDKRVEIYNRYDGHCAYCGCELEYKDMQVDHINSVYLSEMKMELPDDGMDNLMPACRMCNFYKQAYGIAEFRKNLEELLMPNVRRPFDYRLAVKYGLVMENIHPIVFYFEKWSDEKH